ncbi:signal transduction histidine kinase [Actinoplanes octamycinicus]|uniref:histidine kinase n=1 Tax=Actinoplanes octamycinicus TaxID=135948 RepID=A0A7W7H1F6_9ACTN|nr:sensor histidine kinase [Actinoplanes octamycinicus]MBB4742225.1 signal transduction histidine kinase [Actinoplanes octamycinicus]
MLISRRTLLVADVLLSVAVTAAAVLRTPGPGVAVWLLAAFVGLPLAARRRWPLPVFAVTAAAGAGAVLAGVGADVAIWAVALALYPVASSERSPVWALPSALAVILLPGLADALTGRLPVIPTPAGEESFSSAPAMAAAMSVAVIGGSWALARTVRTRRRHAGELARLRTAQAVTEERLRIAREVHDVVGHNLSLIAMNAAVARHLGSEQDAALHTIEQVSRGALDEVRTVLGDLRGAPGLADLDALAGATRAAGVQVTVDAPVWARAAVQPEAAIAVQPEASAAVRSDVPDAVQPEVPAAVQTSAYRIVQEALTNVRRHSGARHCRVTVTTTPDALTLAVVDDGGGADREAEPQHGLAGMRERVALHGGTLSAGPEPGGGFAVRASLPYRKS